jgi:hypothetical protein
MINTETTGDTEKHRENPLCNLRALCGYKNLL